MRMSIKLYMAIGIRTYIHPYKVHKYVFKMSLPSHTHPAKHTVTFIYLSKYVCALFT